MRAQGAGAKTLRGFVSTRAKTTIESSERQLYAVESVKWDFCVLKLVGYRLKAVYF